MSGRSDTATPARGRSRTRIFVQQRDLDMLGSLAEARLLTAEALEWLHFPSWRARYRRCIEQKNQTDSMPYQCNSNLYRRLRGLCDSHYLQRITHSVGAARATFYRLPDAYTLTATGAELLCSRRAIELAPGCVIGQRKRAIQNLDHAMSIGRLYAALHAELEYRGLCLSDWRGDHLLARGAYDRILVAGEREPLPILPDATFVLESIRYFVEIDRGTRPLRSWVDKLRAYETYRASPLLQARYRAAEFRVLIVAPTGVRLTRIAEQIAATTRHATAGYLLLHADLVHPTTIRRGWQRIAKVDWAPKRVVDRVLQSPTVTLAPQPLWEQTA